MRGARALVLGFWSLAALAAVVQYSIERATLGRDAALFRGDRWLLAMWSLAVPAIVWSARRWPVRGDAVRRHVLLHGTVATTFIVATNVIVRLPMLPSGTGAVARSTLLGLARFYPAALIVYGVLLALAQRAWGASAVAASAVPETEVAPPDRVIVREWNRVHLVRPEEIEWIASDDNDVVVHAGGRTYKGRGRIRDLEAQLDPAAFVRVHRSAIVRVASIREVQPLTKGDLAVITHGGKTLRVSRSRRAALEAVLGVAI
jgi:hypothetical protein